jgi:small subunit ribosomal protein S2
VAAEGGKILFVATKRQARARVEDAAKKCGQYFVSHRWLGGMLTNWKTVSQSIKKLDSLEKRLQDQEIALKKKEILRLQRNAEKLTRALGGVRDMGGVPSMLIVLDTNVDRTAVEEARVLEIPVVGVCDTNSDPTIVDYQIPGNDDSIRAIDLYCTLMESAIIDGIQRGLVSSGVDVGAMEIPVGEVKAESSYDAGGELNVETSESAPE